LRRRFGAPPRRAAAEPGAAGRMTVKLDFEECLKDSPRFRAAVETVETDVSVLETQLEKELRCKLPRPFASAPLSCLTTPCLRLRLRLCPAGQLLKLCTTMLDSGHQYCTHSKSFLSGIQELSQNSPGDTMMSECLEKFSSSLNKMIEKHEEFLDVTQQTLKYQLQSLVKEDIKHFKEVRKEFERGSENLASALQHNAEVPRRRQHEAEEAAAALTSARTAFCARALDYVLRINVIQSKKKFEILKFVSRFWKVAGRTTGCRDRAPQMLTLMEAQSLFLEQGAQVTKQLEKYRKDLAAQLHQLVLESAREKREMEQRHTMIKQKDLSQEDVLPEARAEPGRAVMEGYLFKRASNAFKTWSRRWFSIQSNQLVYQKKAK
ncbi:Arf-GAP with coiled-coil, ANK repeat and PH domain-containing protein 1, partial [Varanus komodoensis]